MQSNSEGKRKEQQSCLNPSPTGGRSYLPVAGSGKARTGEQPKLRELISSLVLLKEGCLMQTTLAFRYYNSFLQSQDIMDLIESRNRLGLLSLSIKSKKLWWHLSM